MEEHPIANQFGCKIFTMHYSPVLARLALGG